MLDITILGSSASVPCPKRNLPSIAVRIKGDIILLDCGEGTQRQMMLNKVSYAKVKIVLISHLHLDHFLGLFGLGETLRLSGIVDKIDIFGPVGLERFLSSFGKKDIFNVHELPTRVPENGKKIASINDHDIYAFKVNHNPKMRAYGYKIVEKDKIRFREKLAKSKGIVGEMFKKIQRDKKLKIKNRIIKLSDVSYVQRGKILVYSGDSAYSESLIRASKNADILIHESTFDENYRAEADERFHCTAKDAAQIAKKIKAKQLLLTHISPRYTDKEDILLAEAKRIFKNTKIAFDGEKIQIK